MAEVIDYSSPGPFTSLDGIDSRALEPVADDPVGICLPVHSLVIQPTDAQALNLPAHRFDENQIRPADSLVRRLLALDPAPLTTAREPHRRLVGTCRHFAVLSCALLRYRDVAARVRSGFATYFQPGQGLDHWITEYWDESDARWIRIDSEILGQTVVASPHDLRPGEFLTGGEAWEAYRRGEIDASGFGVHGTQNWGPAEIRGNAVKDLAALNKVETLPWDEWGRMTDAYAGRTGADYDALLDELAGVCATDDPAAVRALYDSEDLRVPEDLIR
ncbi:transglutaminase domain-containing protein [Sinomonas sp. P47F7]|uniref:transglutaminase domain-containing protein n=1 Tax=Sinomonas sp. P47F7 TaxID=3410987 RepID=UPI003BF4CE6E